MGEYMMLVRKIQEQGRARTGEAGSGKDTGQV